MDKSRSLGIRGLVRRRWNADARQATAPDCHGRVEPAAAADRQRTRSVSGATASLSDGVMRFRHQLAAYSPIRPAWIAAAMGSALRPGAVDELRRHLRDAYRANDVALVDSGTHALQLALEVALRARSGGVVAIPGFTCFDVATAVVGSGARVILYDIDPATLQPDFESLESAFRSGASIAVIASLYGMPIRWDDVQSAAAAHDVLVIEDAAQGHGATWKGQPLGSLGDLSVLSFSRGKGWTGGYGGALLPRAVRFPFRK